MEKAKKILVSEERRCFLISREAVDILFLKLTNSIATEIQLDFMNVEFISRSYADQFYKSKLDFEKKYSISIYIVNANEDIINMFHAVSKTQHQSDRSFEKTPVYTFSNLDKFSEYLFSI